MKLTYFQGKVPNFGDELNPYIWNRILPSQFLDENEKEIFLGIGSIIWNNLPKTSIKHVIGSGFGGYTNAPDMHDGSWNVVFVRGPRTAALLGLDPSKAICDGAILLRTMEFPRSAKTDRVAFIPHFHSIPRGFWQEACKHAGIDFIDPRDPVDVVLSQMTAAKMVITEAMHGAIVADAIRVPWVAVQPIHSENRMKWFDWADSLDLPLRQHNLWPSSVFETYLKISGSKKNHGPRAYQLNKSILAAPLNMVLVHTAAARLQTLAKQEPQLSVDDKIASLTDNALNRVQDFVRERTSIQIQAE